MVAKCCRSTPKSNLIHKKGVQSLGWESRMIFSSKLPIWGQAEAQVWPKMTNSVATLAQITCAHGYRQLQKHSKVKIDSKLRIMMTGMGIVHGILSQPQYFLPSWPLFFVKNEQLQGWFGPNDMCKWLQIAAEAFQSQNWFMSKVCKKPKMGIIYGFFIQTKPFSAKLTLKFGQKRSVWGLLWPKLHVCIIVDCFRSIPKSRWVHKHWL